MFRNRSRLSPASYALAVLFVFLQLPAALAVPGEQPLAYDRNQSLAALDILERLGRYHYARLPVDELNEMLGSSLPEGDWDTVGGLLFHLLGRVPSVGDWASSDGWLLVAERVQGRRISRIVVQPASCPMPGTDADGEGTGMAHESVGDRR